MLLRQKDTQYRMKDKGKGHMWQVSAIRVILIALIVLWMSTIFGFSAENGTASQSFSDKITIKIVQILKPDYRDLNVDKQDAFFEHVSFAVRKMGHFGEYAILGILFACFWLTFEKIRTLKKSEIKVLLITAVICMLYAATDEFHQGFVDGRSPKVMDVLIDTLGGMTGAGMVNLAAFFVWRRGKWTLCLHRCPLDDRLQSRNAADSASGDL